MVRNEADEEERNTTPFIIVLCILMGVAKCGVVRVCDWMTPQPGNGRCLSFFRFFVYRSRTRVIRDFPSVSIAKRNFDRDEKITAHDATHFPGRMTELACRQTFLTCRPDVADFSRVSV